MFHLFTSSLLDSQLRCLIEVDLTSSQQLQWVSAPGSPYSGVIVCREAYPKDEVSIPLSDEPSPSELVSLTLFSSLPTVQLLLIHVPPLLNVLVLLHQENYPSTNPSRDVDCEASH